MPSPVPPAQPWSQVGVTPHTQTLGAMPPKLGPCPPTRCPTVGTSVVPLVPLVRFLEAWQALPSLSHWLIRTVRLGYAIQFSLSPRVFTKVDLFAYLNTSRGQGGQGG